MRKVCAKICAVMLILVASFSLTACSLFTDNLDKKYSANIMVASAGDNAVTVSKKELYDAYTQWGYQYASSMEEEELLEALTEYILNEKIVRQKSLEQFGELYDIEKATAMKAAFSAVDNTLRKYVYEALNLEDKDDADATTSETSDQVQYEPYNKTILVNTVGNTRTFTLNLESYANASDDLNMADYSHGYTPNVPGVASTKVAKQALSKIVRNLKVAESGFSKLENSTKYLNLENSLIAGLTKAEQYSLNREIARLIENNEKSILTARMSTAYALGIEDAAGWQDYLRRGEDFTAWQEAINADRANISDLDAWNQAHAYHAANGRSIAENQANSAIEYYLDKVESAILANQLSPDDNLEATIMGGSLEDYFYIPQAVANNLFTVSHILVGFTDEQKTQYKQIQEAAAADPAYDADEALSALYAQTMSNGKSVYEIYTAVKAALNETDDLPTKYEIFRDFIYQYNTDQGMQNPTYEYLMSVNKDNNKMIEPFTEASLALKAKGTKGAISGIVWGDYGAHIIMYTRDVSDFIYTGTLKELHNNYADSLFAPLTAYGNKTKFDVLAEYFTRNYSNHQAALLRQFKYDNEVSIVTSSFKNFLKK